MTKRDVDRRQIERRAPEPAVNVRYEDKDKARDWAPKRIRRARPFSTNDVRAILPKLIK